jgi:hypothetical protein
MQFARHFRAVAFWLVDHNELTARERDRYFWCGLPQAARTAIDRRLEVRDPDYSRSEAPDFHKAVTAGRFVFSDEAPDVNRMSNLILSDPRTACQPPPATLPSSRPYAMCQPSGVDNVHDRYGRDAPREVETRTPAPPVRTAQKPITDDVEDLIGLMPAAAQVWTAPRMPHQPHSSPF